MNKVLALLLGIAIFIGLSSHTTMVQSVLDLTASGIPVSVDAPEGAKISNGIGHGMEMDGVKTYVLEVEKGAFQMEIMMEDDAMWQETSDYLNDEKESVSEEDDFDSYITSEDRGFVYKMNTEDGPDYGFYWMLKKNDRLIEFRAGLYMSEFTLDQINTLYTAAKNAK